MQYSTPHGSEPLDIEVEHVRRDMARDARLSVLERQIQGLLLLRRARYCRVIPFRARSK